MTRHPRPAVRRRRPGPAVLGLVLGLGVLAACGEESTAPAAAPAPSPTAAPSGRVDPLVTEPVRVPTPGLVEIDGEDGPLTTRAVRAFTPTSQYQVSKDLSGDNRAFERLCLGDVDLVDSSRPITAEEYAQCEALGLQVYQYQVASDGIVVAIKNETDVGGDCLTTEQAREIYAAGSEVTTWSQLGDGYDDVPLDAGGPPVEDSVFQYFDRFVLGSPEPSSTNFRSDYVVGRVENDTRLFVVGSEGDKVLVRNIEALTERRNALRRSLLALRQVVVGKQEQLDAALKRRQKGFDDGRSAADQAEDQRLVDRAFEERRVWIIRRNAAGARYVPVNEAYQKAVAAQERLDGTVGNVGLFQFSYSQVYENQLRPFEIEIGDDGDGQRNCIYPSAPTILSGEYPLSRNLLVTTTSLGLERPEVRAFLTFYLERAERLATEASLIALPRADLQRQVDWITNGRTPPLAVVDGEVVVTEADADAEEVPMDQLPTPGATATPQAPAR
ncbi:substrate-binding domain-containing protein [Nocardioides sp.]|uniref:substrate-binding domain-containing protein n=1 Tax=Nocardioides sp. TaxID=35761 RepID=UPI003516ADA2